ncbi:MAG: dihydroorotase [Candidatus Omnitrophica bacterium]|nr:dihydroorotase [Candidatus Omnitrophota bacterium]
MKILIKHPRVIDPVQALDGVRDILIEHGKIKKVAEGLQDEAARVIDASGCIALPGLVDMHVHLREPGREDKETIASGTRAALFGGVTSVLAMPNTAPAIDSVAHIRLLKERIRKTAAANVYICAAITKGRQGKELTPFAQLKAEGALAISDDGSSVDSTALMFEAFKSAKEHDLLVICHCQDSALSGSGVVNLGFTSTRTGLRGISSESEFRRVERDLGLAAEAGARVHIAHVSCRESVALIAAAKKKGVRVTAETAPHYFTLTEESVLGYDTNMKMNPPLRSAEDRQALRQALGDGTIDIIASDHAPHTENEKEIEFERAEFGVIGLQTELSLAINELLEPGFLDWTGLVQRISLAPARVLGLHKGTLGIGVDADIVIVDPRKDWVVTKESLVSKSKNSSFLGKRLPGTVAYTICNGVLAYENQREAPQHPKGGG